MPRYIIMLGGPGAGKGTQAKLLFEKLKIPHISTGDLFLEHIEKGTELGKKVKEVKASGDLVSDDILMKLVKERLHEPDCAGGAIFDGVPRTFPQAKALDNLLDQMNSKLEIVIYVDISEEEMEKRMSTRWICKKESHIYSELVNPPKVPGICDIDGSPLYQKAEDKEAGTRIAVYFKKTAPLLEYYQNKGILKRIDGEQSIGKVHEDVMKIMQ